MKTIHSSRNLLSLAVTSGLWFSGLFMASPAYAVKVNDTLSVNAKVFANFSDISGNADDAGFPDTGLSGSQKDDAASSFHFDRAYFEIRGKTSEADMIRITLDQKAADKQVFVKYAYWQHRYTPALTIKAGQNHTPLVDYLQSKMWGHRYVQKTFTDYYGAQTSSDLGVSALGDFGKHFSYYVSLMNGEGYTHTTDGAGYALMGRFEWHTSGFHIGVFGHSETDHKGIANYDPTRAEVYAWWKNDFVQIGGQYLSADDGSSSQGKFNNAKGYNILANVRLPSLGRHTVAFLRYDSMDEKDNGDNHTLAIAGVEFRAAKGVKLAVDYQADDKGTTASKTLRTIALHGQFKF